MTRIPIAVDAMGGDYAPEATVIGAVQALRAYDDIDILLYGRSEAMAPFLEAARPTESERNRLTVIHAETVITMDEAPTLAVRRKLNSSLVMAMLDVKAGRAQALVSAGSTGAVLAGGILRIGRIPGIDRPATAPLVPGITKPWLLIDSGANVDCQPKYLVQFGLMGSVFMQKVMGVPTPNVGLVNIGVEPEKGNRLVKETYALMQAQTAYAFGGNLEARDLMSGSFDVAVADGFAGNVIIKGSEGVAAAFVQRLTDAILASRRAKLGALFMKPALRALKRSMSADEYGGAPLLGVQNAVIKAHGNAKARTIECAIGKARAMVQGDVVRRIREGLDGLVSLEEPSTGTD